MLKNLAYLLETQVNHEKFLKNCENCEIFCYFLLIFLIFIKFLRFNCPIERLKPLWAEPIWGATLYGCARSRPIWGARPKSGGGQLPPLAPCWLRPCCCTACYFRPYLHRDKITI